MRTCTIMWSAERSGANNGEAPGDKGAFESFSNNSFLCRLTVYNIVIIVLYVAKLHSCVSL